MITLARESMRTRFEIVLPPDDSGRFSPADLRAAGEESLAEVARVEGWLSAYRSDADLFRVNALADQKPVRVDARTFALLQHASDLTEATNGAFDMTVGPLLRVWGLGGGTSSEGGYVPSSSERNDAQALVGMTRHVCLDNDTFTVAFDRAGVRLDPGAIGKGYALDRAATLLREAGIVNALLHGGTSTVVALGSPGSGETGWRIALQHPLRPDAHLGTVLLPSDSALSVSAVHGKTFWADGRQFGHVIDPRTGQPVAETLLAAVVASSATETDALSTALLVLGAAGVPVLAKRFPETVGWLTVSDTKVDAAPRVEVRGDVWEKIQA